MQAETILEPSPSQSTRHRTAPVQITRSRVFAGLLYRQWLLHGHSLCWWISGWFIGLFVLQLFDHPIWIAIYTLSLATSSGIRGGSDITEGSEAFTFCLPVSRSEQYLAGMLLPLGTLLALNLGGMAAIHGQWPQALWGLFVTSGMTAPPTSYGMDESWGPVPLLATMVGPVIVYFLTYANAALCRTPKQVAGSVGTVFMFVFCGMWAFAWVEILISGNGSDGRLTLGIWCVLGVVAAVGGLRSYSRKQLLGEAGNTKAKR